MEDCMFVMATGQYEHPRKIAVFTVGHHSILAIAQERSEIIALSHDLTLLRERNFLLRWGKYVQPKIAASRDGIILGISEMNSVRVMTIDGVLLFQQEHDAWGAFQGGDLIFSEKYVFYIMPGPSADLLITREILTFRIVSSVALPGHRGNNYTFYRTPDHKRILLEASAGQNEGTLFLIKEFSGDIEVEEVKPCHDRVMGSFSPDGSMFVTAPHYDEGIEWYSFPSVKRVGEISQAVIFSGRNTFPAMEADTLDYQVFFMAKDLVAALTRFGRILVINTDSKKVVAELILRGLEPKGYDKEGKETRDPGEIRSYESDIAFLQFITPNRILALHASGKLLSYILPLEGLQ